MKHKELQWMSIERFLGFPDILLFISSQGELPW